MVVLQYWGQGFGQLLEGSLILLTLSLVTAANPLETKASAARKYWPLETNF